MGTARPTPDPSSADEHAAYPVVSAVNVSKRYGVGDAEVIALHDVSVSFRRSSLTAIMGPSGSGKSTLMHILAGLDKPTSGRILVDGEDITNMSDRQLTLIRRRKVGFVFQFFNLLPTLSAEENILLPLKIARESTNPDLFRTIVSSMGLEDRLNHRPAQLSGGQQQRVAIARALISDPAVIFADEPTGNLDSASTRDVLALLRRAVDDLQHTIIMVTHEPAAAATADRVVFLSDGMIVRDQPNTSIEGIFDIMKDLS